MTYFALCMILAIATVAYSGVKLRIHRRQMQYGKLKKGKQRLTKLHSRPRYYGYCAFLWTAVPAFGAYAVLRQFGQQDAVGGLTLPALFAIALALAIASYTLLKLKAGFRARVHVEKWIKFVFMASAGIAVSITIFIIGSVLTESIHFFEKVPVSDFLFGTQWSPQTALRADQAGSSGSFGAIPVFVGTLLITFIAMCVAAPLGLFSAIYLSEYASKRARTYLKPVLEILAGIPTVVYGYFAAVMFGPALKHFGESIGLNIAAESALAAGLVMGIMIIPFVMSLSDDVMNAVPEGLREASLGLGATRAETVRQVVLPAALPGVMGALLLGVSRGIGETMIVVMAAGLAANLTINPLDSVTTVTAQIVSLLVGDQEFDSAKTLAAFALSLTLFMVTLLLNFIAMWFVKTYRERYE